jgi:hypothetical protein
MEPGGLSDKDWRPSSWRGQLRSGTLLGATVIAVAGFWGESGSIRRKSGALELPLMVVTAALERLGADGSAGKVDSYHDVGVS